MNASVEKEIWEIVGVVPANDGGPKRHIGVSSDGRRYAVLVDMYGQWSIKAGPWSYETLLHSAELVCAGDKRAITWPDAVLCLAAGYVALHCEAERRRIGADNSASTDVPAAASASVAEGPPASVAFSPSPLPPAGRCQECGG